MENSNKSTTLSIIKALDGNSVTGLCRCPAHDDSTPSLKVTQGDRGVLVHCHAGCAQEKVISALREKGLWPNQAPDWMKIGSEKKPKTEEPANTIRTERVLLERVRTEKVIELEAEHEEPEDDDYSRQRKAFAILRAAAKANAGPPEAYLKARGIDVLPENAMLLSAGESKKLTGKLFPSMVFPVVNADGEMTGCHLTRLNRNADAKLNTDIQRQMFGVTRGGFVELGRPQELEPLIIAEGIETALSASQIAGLPAIAALSSSNMKALRLPHCGEVIICADNDEPGLEAAQALARKLKISDPERVVRIAVPKGKGFDWNGVLLQADADIRALRKSILKAKRVRAPADGLALGVDEFLSLEFPPRHYLMKPWLTTTGINMVYARRGAGKSMFALALAYAVAKGEPFLKWSCERRARVLYIDGELPGELLQKRLKMFGSPPPVEDLKIISRNRVEKQKGSPLDLSKQEDRQLLDSIIEDSGAELIILDSILTLFSADTQKDFVNWLEIQNWAYRHRDAGRSILYIHHESTSGRQFGTSGREIPFDSTLRIQQDPNVKGSMDETALKLSFEKARDFYGADAAPLLAFLSTADGIVEWRYESDAENKKERVLNMKKLNMKQRDMAKELGIGESRVSQIVNELMKEKRL